MTPLGAQGVAISVQAISCLEHSILISIPGLLLRKTDGALNTLSCFILYSLFAKVDLHFDTVSMCKSGVFFPHLCQTFLF